MVLPTLFAALALAQIPAPQIVVVPRSSFAASQNERKVSLHVSDASLKDVLAKLPKIDYAVDAEAFKDRRITLFLSEVALSSALDSIAAALDAHWETVGAVHVLKKGPALGFGGTSFRAFTEAPSAKAFEFLRGKNGDLFKLMPPDGLKSLPDGSKAPFMNGKGFQGLSPERQKEIQKAIEKAQKQLKIMPNVNLQIQKALESAKGAKTMSSGIDADALLKSITPAQKELAKSQGYLKGTDLTPEQRKLACITEEGSIVITISRHGESITIKNS